jgi:quercetin dioxygenase-like cupin family protein
MIMGKEGKMKIIPPGSSTKGPAHMFSGDVYFDIIVKGEEPSRVRVNSVHFAPGARTAWHSHAVGQTLHVSEGIGVVQERDGEITILHPGDTIHTLPGVWHWHGATKDHFMTHLAIWEAPESGPESDWGDLVSDEEYEQQPDS